MRDRLILLLAVLTSIGGLAAVVAAPPAAAAGANVPVITLRSSSNPSTVGETVTLTASVNGAFGAPTGTVAFKQGATVLGVGTLSTSDGTTAAAITTPFALAGDHEVVAAYSGDSTYAAASSVARTQTVDATVTRRTWAVASGSFSNAANWNPVGTPQNGETLVFPEVVAVVNDLPALSVEHLSFMGGLAQWSGNSLTLTGSMHNDSANSLARVGSVALSAGDHVVDGQITVAAFSGPGGLIKTGPSELGLGGPSTYTGATVIKAGVAWVSPDGGLGSTSSGTTVAAGASIAWGAGGTTSEPLSLAGDGAPGTGLGALHVSGAYLQTTLAGPITLTGARVTATTSANASTLITGAVSGSSSALRLNGTGAVTLNGAGSFKSLDVQQGAVTAGSPAALGAIPVSLAEGSKLVLTSGAADTLASYESAVSVSSAAVETTGPGSVLLRGSMTVAGSGVTFRIPAQVLYVTGVVSGTGLISKQGVGILALAAPSANTFEGSTAVVEGGLVLGSNGVGVDGPLWLNTGTAAVMAADHQLGDWWPLTLSAGSIFDFYGFDEDNIGAFVSSSADIYFGLADPAGSYSTVKADAMSLNGGSLNFAVGRDGHDLLRVSSLVVSAELNLNGDLPRGSTTKLIDNYGTGPVQGQFTGLGEGASIPVGNVVATISYKGGDGNDVVLTVPPSRSGYWMLDQRGRVYAFGDAKHYGEPFLTLNASGDAVKAVDIEPTADFGGYWVLTDRGEAFPYGNAPGLGYPYGRLAAGEMATSISNDGYNNYWVFTNKGRVFDYGDAGHYKDMAGVPLNGPVLGSVGTASGFGYFMVASDGGIFSFGDAVFRGSMGGKPLNGAVVGLAPDPDNDGYWLVASDGGIFAFNAGFKGSMGGKPLNKPVIGMVAYGDGYLMVASDGGIFNFSTKAFKGSLGGQAIPSPIAAVAPLNEV